MAWPPLLYRLCVNADVASSIDAAEHQAVIIRIEQCDGKALRAAHLLKGIETDEPNVLIAALNRPAERIRALIELGQSLVNLILVID